MDDTTDVGGVEAAINQLLQPEEPEQEPVEQAAEEEPEEEETEAEESETEGEHEDPDVDDDPDEDETEEADEPVTPQSFTVTVDGNETEVSLDELKRGYAGQQSITQRFQELSTQRKEVEQFYGQLAEAQNNLNTVLNQLQSDGVPVMPVEPSRELFNSDPVRYVSEKVEYDEKKAAYDQRVSEMEAVKAQQDQLNEVAQRAYVQREQEALAVKVPELRDPKARDAIKERVLSAAKHYGYTEEDLGSVMDHRAMMILIDAAKYQEVLSGKDKATEKAKNTKPIKPGVKKAVKHSRTQRDKKLRQKLRQTGSPEDVIDLLIQP